MRWSYGYLGADICRVAREPQTPLADHISIVRTKIWFLMEKPKAMLVEKHPAVFTRNMEISYSSCS